MYRTILRVLLFKVIQVPYQLLTKEATRCVCETGMPLSPQMAKTSKYGKLDVFVKHGCPRRQQSQTMAKISKSYIFDPAPSPRACDASEVWATIRWTNGSVPVETYSPNWIWPRSIFIIGRVWPWNWYCTHINLNNVILWGIIPICKICAKTWHCLFCFGALYSFWPFPLTRECALHLRPCKKIAWNLFRRRSCRFSRKRYVQSLNKFYILRNRK